MGSAVNRYVGSEESAGSNTDQARIQNRTVVVDEYALSYLEICTIICMDWSHDPWILGQ
jgi:hypothetical protein